MASWSGRTIDLELEGVRELDVRMIGGDLNITAAPGPERPSERGSPAGLERPSERGGPAGLERPSERGGAGFLVTVEGAVERGRDIEVELGDDGVLRITHDREPGVLGSMFGMGSASASIVISVPATTIVTARTVSAGVFLAGIQREVGLNTVSGAITATSVRGGVTAKTVSGAVELQDTDGNLEVTSVSGDVTATAAIADRLAVRSVSGDITLDLDGLGEASLNSVSGTIAIRLPAEAGVAFEARTVSGHLDCGFQLCDEQSSKRRLRGRVGDGESRLVASTVSGDVALLRREAVAA